MFIRFAIMSSAQLGHCIISLSSYYICEKCILKQYGDNINYNCGVI